MATNKIKKSVPSKKSGSEDFHKPNKMKPVKGKKKNWDDEEDALDEPVLDDDFKGFDDLGTDEDDDDF